METASIIKERLHDRINEINDLDILKAMEKKLIECIDETEPIKGGDLLFNESNAEYIKTYVDNLDDTGEQKTDDEILKMLKEREARYLSGEDKAYTIEEVNAKIFKKYGF